jgi:hypothetical protein
VVPSYTAGRYINSTYIHFRKHFEEDFMYHKMELSPGWFMIQVKKKISKKNTVVVCIYLLIKEK